MLILITLIIKLINLIIIIQVYITFECSLFNKLSQTLLSVQSLIFIHINVDVYYIHVNYIATLFSYNRTNRKSCTQRINSDCRNRCTLYRKPNTCSNTSKVATISYATRQLCPRYEGQLTWIAEPICHSFRSRVRPHDYHHSGLRTDELGRTERVIERGRYLRTILTQFVAEGVVYSVGPVRPSHSAPSVNYHLLGW